MSNIPAAQCIDSDGDGYGWDGIQTCLVSVDGNEETSTSQCIDEEGDGFGWNGVATCIPNSSSLVGVISVGAFTSIDANGALLAYPADISAFFTESAEWIEEFFTTGLDQCRVTVERFNPEDSSYDIEVFATDNFPGLPTGSLNYITIGESLTVTGPGMFSSDLSEGVDAGYFLAENSGLATSGLQISIPQSARFAAFTDVGIPDVVPVDRPGLDPQQINAETVFNWSASGDEQSVIVIDLIGGDNDSEIFCIARDDGEFAYPDLVKQRGGSSYDYLDFSRIAWKKVTQGDSALYLLNSNGFEYY